MTTQTQFGLKTEERDPYQELSLTFPLSSFLSEEHLTAALQVMDTLLAKGQLVDGEERYLAALSDLVGRYEDEHHVIKPAKDADMLRHLMETKGITEARLSQEAGIAESTICEVLRGEKPLSRQLIRKLSEFFEVEFAVLAGNL